MWGKGLKLPHQNNFSGCINAIFVSLTGNLFKETVVVQEFRFFQRKFIEESIDLMVRQVKHLKIA